MLLPSVGRTIEDHPVVSITNLFPSVATLYQSLSDLHTQFVLQTVGIEIITDMTILFLKALNVINILLAAMTEEAGDISLENNA